MGCCFCYKTTEVDTKRRGRTISFYSTKALRRLTKRNGNKVTKDSVFVSFVHMTSLKAKSSLLIPKLLTKHDRCDDHRARRKGEKQEKV